MLSGRAIKQRMLADGIDERTVDLFMAWLRDHKAVWLSFERFALAAHRAGRKMGAKAIAERCRWEAEIERNEEWKVNNNFTAYLARLFMWKHGTRCFEVREIKGLKEAA